MHAVQSTGWFAELLADHRSPCVSIYFPANRAAPPADENGVHFRDLLVKAMRELKNKFPDKQGKAVLRQLHSIPAEQLGPGPHDGMAIFASPDYLQVLDLQQRVDDLVVVADSFHIKPLIRTMQQGDRFEILCFSPNRIRILESNEYSVSEVPLRNVPASIAAARVVPVGGTPSDQPVIKLEHFMRLVDRAVWDHHSRVSHLPLILACDAQNCSDFIALSKNQYLLDNGIALNPEHVSNDRLREEAWKLVSPRYQEELERLNEQFRVARAHAKGSDQLTQVAEAAAVGRVGTLIVDANRHIPGVLHRASGMIEQANQFDPRAEDVLDDLAEMVLKMDGQVYVLPHEQMPTDAGLAAMYRY